MILHWFTTDVQLSNRQWEQPQAEQRPWVGNSSNVCPGRKWGCQSFFKLCYITSIAIRRYEELLRDEENCKMNIQKFVTAGCMCGGSCLRNFPQYPSNSSKIPHRRPTKNRASAMERIPPCCNASCVARSDDCWDRSMDFSWGISWVIWWPWIVILFYLMIACTNERTQKLWQLIQNTTLGTPAHQSL